MKHRKRIVWSILILVLVAVGIGMMFFDASKYIITYHKVEEAAESYRENKGNVYAVLEDDDIALAIYDCTGENANSSTIIVKKSNKWRYPFIGVKNRRYKRLGKYLY